MKPAFLFLAPLLLVACSFHEQKLRVDHGVGSTSCAPDNIEKNPDLRLECNLRRQILGCEGDYASSEELGVQMQDRNQSFRFHRGLQRFRFRTGDERRFCDLTSELNREVLREALAPPRARSESGKEWLMMRLGGPSGKVDSSAMASALETRRRLTVVGSGKIQEKGTDIVEKDTRSLTQPAAASLAWTNLTGYTQSSGRINHLLIHPVDTDTMWIGSDGGGIWKTTDGGVTWNNANDFLGSLSVATLVMDPADSNVIFAATNPRGSHTYYPFGILKSTDGGITWNQLAATNPAANADWTYVTWLAIHPADGNTLLAATDGGAYLTVNGGVTWTKVADISTRATFVAFHPSDGNIRAVAYNDGTFRYTTTGDLMGTGAFAATVLSSGNYMKFAFAPSDSSRVYALITESATGATKLYKSTTGGGAWSDITNTLSNLPNPGYAGAPFNFFYNNYYLSYTGNLWVDPFDKERLAIVEGWATFTPNASAATIPRYDLCSGWVDFHAVVAHPGYNGSTNKTVFFMDDGGLYKITDVDQLSDNVFSCANNGFARLETGATITQVYSVSGRGGNPILGAQDVGPRVYRTGTVDSEDKWRFVGRPDACSSCNWIGDGGITAASRDNASVLYGSRQYLDFFRSTDGGLSANSIALGTAITEGQGIASPNYDTSFIAPFVLDPSNQSRMYAGGNSLWRSENVDTGNPPTWISIRAPLEGPYCSAIDTIAVAPSDPNIVWIAYLCTGRVFKTANALSDTPTWDEVTTLPVSANYGNKASILFDRIDANIVWIGLACYCSNNLYMTTDGGTTSGNWTTLSGLPSAPVNALLQHPADNNLLYAGTGVGLFASNDGGNTWSTTNEGPANVVINSMSWYSESGSSADMLVGTFGRGVFRATVSAQELTMPGAPAVVSVIVGDGSVVVIFTHPTDDGGSAVTGFTATCVSSNGGVTGSATGVSSTTSIRVDGLTNDKSYTCTVTAANSVGTSLASPPSSAVIPIPSQDDFGTLLPILIKAMELQEGTAP